MKITVIGATGYVGLTYAVGMASLGHTVFGIGRDKRKILQLRKGRSPIFEPGLEELLKKNLRGGRLFFQTDSALAVLESDLIFICVGTPSGEDGSADLSQVEGVAKTIGQILGQVKPSKRHYKVIVNKSTVPIGTGDLFTKIIRKYYDGPFDVLSNPEFLREGSAVLDFFKPDRIVIGGGSSKAKEILKKAYQKLKAPVVETDLKTAEMIKYASNAYLATSISFINSLSQISEKVGADVTQVSQGMKLDPRIGQYAQLRAGPGYGGSCFPKDVQALISIAKQNFSTFPILEAVEEANLKQRQFILEKIKFLLPSLENKKIAIWGVAFKAGTDDIRESPAIPIISELLNQKAKISVFDPKASKNISKIFPSLKISKTAQAALQDSDLLLILTDWEELKKFDLRKLKNLLSKPLVVDARNIYQPKVMESLGFKYLSVGRQLLEPKVSIIMPIEKITAEIGQAVSEILKIDFRNFELVILPDQISATKLQTLKNLSEKVTVIATGKVTPALKREIGLEKTTGELLAFLGKGAFPALDWLKWAVAHFQDSKVAVVGGPTKAAPAKSLSEDLSASVLESFLGGGTARYRFISAGQARTVEELPSTNLLVRREAVLAVGGFDTTLWSGDDTKFCQQISEKLSQKIIYDPKVAVYQRKPDLWGHLKEVARFALHRGFFAKKFPKTSLRFIHLAPSALVILLLGTGLLWLSEGLKVANPTTASGGLVLGLQTSRLNFSPLMVALFLLLLYLAALIVSAINLFLRKKNLVLAILLIPAIFLTHLAYGIYFISGLLRTKLS